VDDERFVRDPHGELAGIAKLDISGAIIDLLEVRGAGHWHVPSPEEIEAELDHGDAIAARLRAQHES
jgi:hypothetical protein